MIKKKKKNLHQERHELVNNRTMRVHISNNTLDSDSSYGVVVKLYLFYHQILSNPYEYLFIDNFFFLTLYWFHFLVINIKIKIDKHVKAKLYVKLQLPQDEYVNTIFLFWFFIDFLISYNIKI